MDWTFSAGGIDRHPNQSMHPTAVAASYQRNEMRATMPELPAADVARATAVGFPGANNQPPSRTIGSTADRELRVAKWPPFTAIAVNGTVRRQI
jgi:hypothetical protein